MERTAEEYTAGNQLAIPVFHGGKVLSQSADLRDKAQGDRGFNEKS